jgi:hypothetical protein
MVIGRARSNHRAEIEDQYSILSQMIEEISFQFKERLEKIDHMAKEDANEQSEGEYEIYSSVINSYSHEIERSESMCLQARQILFCSIYAYYETMLNRIICYHKVHATCLDLNDAKSMVTRICEEYKTKTEKDIQLENEEFVNDYCRLLRNHFMHGVLIKENNAEAISRALSLLSSNSKFRNELSIKSIIINKKLDIHISR